MTSFQLLRLTGVQLGEMLSRLSENRLSLMTPGLCAVVLGIHLLLSAVLLVAAGRRLARRS